MQPWKGTKLFTKTLSFKLFYSIIMLFLLFPIRLFATMECVELDPPNAICCGDRQAKVLTLSATK